MRLMLAAAASVLIVVGLTTWTILRQRDSGQLSAVVDLRDRSMARGTEPPPSERPVLIPRKVVHLEIYLPLGSSEGPYDLRINSVSNELLFSGTGEAKLTDGLTELHVDLRKPLARPGDYLLQIRRHDSEWVSFPLQAR